MDLVERLVSQPRNLETRKIYWERRVGQSRTGGSMSLPVVLMGGRGLPK